MRRRKRSNPTVSPESVARPARFGHTTLLHAAALAAVSFALYARTLWNGFVADDTSEVLQDRLIRSFKNIGVFFGHSVWYFTGATADRYYRPLKLLAYSIEYHLFGFRPAYWHLVNILVNAGVVLAIYFLVGELATVRPTSNAAGEPERLLPDTRFPAVQGLAFWTAVFFAFHPIHVEAVAWVAGGNDLWCGLALVVSLWLYRRGRTQGSPVWNYTLSAAAFLVALLFKETALTFPAVILSYDFLYDGESIREILRGCRRYVGYFVVLGAYLALRWHALGGFAPNNPDLRITTRGFLLSVPALAAEYVWKSLAPVHLSFWHEFHPVRAWGWGVAGTFALLLFFVAAALGLRRRQPLLSFGIAWFWITLAPVLDIPKLGDNVLTERYLYIPSFGVCLIAAWAWLWLREKAPLPVLRPLAYACLAAVLALGATVVYRRLPDWRNDFRLFTSTLRQAPDSPGILNEVGSLYFERNDPERALGYFQRAVALAPHNSLARNNLGSAYLALHQLPEAFGETQEAVLLNPNLAPAWANLCALYNVFRQWENAANTCGQALSIDPGNYSAHTQFGLALWNTGRRDQAISEQRRAIELDPSRLEAYFYLAICEADLGRYNQAAGEIALGLRADPRGKIAYLAHYELGAIHQIQGHPRQAAQEYEQALALNPSYAPARTQLQAIRSSAGHASN
jgi:tetratricopeptide (TPR) repeat protein